MIAKNHFTVIRSAAIMVVTTMIAAVVAQATTIDIDQLALWAGGTIGLGNGVSINAPIASGRNVSIGNNANLSSIYTESNVWLGNNSIVSGDVLAGGGVQTGRNVAINGSSDSFSDFTLPQLDLIQQSAIGTDNIYGSKYNETTLLAGEYRDWSFDKDTILNLSAGEYSLRNFWMDKNSVVNIDTSAGDVTLDIVGQFSTANSVSFLKSGSGNLFINVFGNNAWLGSGTNLTAILKVYGGNFGADNSAELTGSFYATGNIWLANNSQIEYISSQVIPIPEPSSVAIFAIASFCFMVKGKNRLGSRF